MKQVTMACVRFNLFPRNWRSLWLLTAGVAVLWAGPALAAVQWLPQERTVTARQLERQYDPYQTPSLQWVVLGEQSDAAQGLEAFDAQAQAQSYLAQAQALGQSAFSDVAFSSQGSLLAAGAGYDDGVEALEQIRIDFELTEAMAYSLAGSLWEQMGYGPNPGTPTAVASVVLAGPAGTLLELDPAGMWTYLHDSIGMFQGARSEGTLDVSESGLLGPGRYSLTIASQVSAIFYGAADAQAMAGHDLTLSLHSGALPEPVSLTLLTVGGLLLLKRRRWGGQEKLDSLSNTGR